MSTEPNHHNDKCHDRFDSIKSDGNIVAADQFFLSHVDCDNKVVI